MNRNARFDEILFVNIEKKINCIVNECDKHDMFEYF